MPDDNSVLGLSTIRRNRGITLQQIANSTKIGVRLLEAIEQGDFKRLPGGIYNTSYIRQYARAIDYDETALLAYYHGDVGGLATQSQAGGNGGSGYTGLRSPSTITGS